MPSSGYTAISFTAGEQPTTAKWNLVGSNDASFNNGNGFNDNILITRHFATSGLQLPDKILNPYKFSAYSNSAQTPAAGVWTLVNVDTKLFDTSTNFNTTTHLFTAPIAGFYHFNAGVGFNATPDNQLLAIGLIKNATSGTPNYQGPTVGNASGSNNVASLDFSRTLQLNANDTIGLMAYSASGLGIVSGNAPMYTMLECFLESAT